MNDTTRIILIALGVAILVVILLPLLFMSGMMGGGSMMGGGPWIMVGLVLLVLAVGATLVVLGVRRR